MTRVSPEVEQTMHLQLQTAVQVMLRQLELLKNTSSGPRTPLPPPSCRTDSRWAGWSWHLVPLSAETPEALQARLSEFRSGMQASPGTTLSAWAEGLADQADGNQPWRAFVLARNATDACAAIDGNLCRPASLQGKARQAAFLFPGLGDHYADMARGLYEADPLFREETERWLGFLKTDLGLDLAAVLYPPRAVKVASPTSPPKPAPKIDLRKMLRRTADGEATESAAIGQTLHAHPSIFVIEYALARLWMSHGIRPDAMIGFSLGEYTAGCLAGVLRPEDAMRLIVGRARLIEELVEPGAMLAVPLDEAKTTALLPAGVTVAAVCAPTTTVVAGPVDAIAAFEAVLHDRESVVSRRLSARHAFHTPMLDPIRPGFSRLLAGVRLHAPRLPYVSNLTGTWMTPGEATDRSYWVEHSCRTVRFADGLGELLRQPGRVCLEVGPGRGLGGFALQHPLAHRDPAPIVLPSLRNLHENEADECVWLRTLGALWLAGVKTSWRPTMREPDVTVEGAR